jgi:hypothetical protein
MEKKNLLLIIIIFFNILYGCKNKSDNIPMNINNKEKISVQVGNQKKDLIFSFDKVSNSDRERIWKDYKMFPKFKIGTIADTTFLYPGRIKIDLDENIYVLDFMDFSVKKFDKTGKFIRKYGKKGKGPGELINPYDFDVFNNDEVTLIGHNDNKFIVFDENKIYEYKNKLMPGRIAFISPNEVVTLQIMDPIESASIQKIDFKNDLTTNYKNILMQNSFGGENLGMIPFLVGDLHRYDSNKLLYVSSILGYVVLYNVEGEIIKVFKLKADYQESKIEKKEIEINNQRIVFFPRQEEYLFESSGVYGDNLFILINPIRCDPQKYIVDIYSISEGEYKYSLLFNENSNLKEVFLTDDKIYLIRENTEVEVFNYSMNE